MNFKTINTILSLLSLNLLVLSSPITEKRSLNDGSVIGIDNYLMNDVEVFFRPDNDKFQIENLIEDSEIDSTLEETIKIENLEDELPGVNDSEEEINDNPDKEEYEIESPDKIIPETEDSDSDNNEIENPKKELPQVNNSEEENDENPDKEVPEIENPDNKEVPDDNDSEEENNENPDNKEITDENDSEEENDENPYKEIPDDNDSEEENDENPYKEIPDDNDSEEEDDENPYKEIPEDNDSEEERNEDSDIDEITTTIYDFKEETSYYYEEKPSEIDDDDDETYDINNSEKSENVCNTQECIKVSNDLLNSIDPSVNPCDDFYQFTCGNWMKNNPVAENALIVRNFNKEANNIKSNLKKIIEGDYQTDKNLSKEEQELDDLLFKKLNGFYNDCLNIDKVNEDGVNTLLNLIDELKIKDNREKFTDIDELSRTVAKIHDNKINEMILFHSDIDFGNDEKSKYISFSEGSYVEFDREEIINVFSKLYENSNEKLDFKKISELIIDFNSRVMYGKGKVFNNDEDDIYENANINGIVDDTESDKNHLRSFYGRYNPEDEKEEEDDDQNQEEVNIITLRVLSEKYPNFNWKLYLEEKFDQIGMKDIINDDTEIILFDEEYFDRLNSLLGEVDSETLSYYFEWYIIYSLIDYIPVLDKIVHYYKNFDKPRNDTCYYIVSTIMDDVIGRFYIQKYFSPEKKEYAEKLIEYIKQSMINRIPEMEWLDDDTIDYALKKVASMNETVGYQDYLLNVQTVYDKYEEMEISENNTLKNIINYYKYTNKENLKNIIPDYLNINAIEYSPQTINAHYIFRINSFSIPAGILQPPFFSSGIPDYINYGGIGSVIGHELTHAFDSTGKNYDMNGDYSNWWTDDDLIEYKDLTKCFINQYNNYTIPDPTTFEYRIDGKATLNENLADNGGIARAFEAWKYSLMEDPETVEKQNQQLPGLTQYSPEQLFFISFGHLWCTNTKYTDRNFLKLIHDGDPHAPGMFRVNGVVSNSDEFAKAFNCPVNSNMNPEKKCTLW